MIIRSTKIYEKEFKNKISKKAYLDACKWLAQNVYKDENLSKNVSVKIEKKKEAKIPTFKVIIFGDVDEGKLEEDFCSKCKRLHSIMYCIEKMNCDECKMKGFEKTNKRYCEGLLNIYRKIIEDNENDNENA